MNGISNYSVRPNALPANTAAAKIGAATGSNAFGPLVTGALSAAALASAPSSSAVCAISQEGLSELAKVSRDAYRAADGAFHATTSFVGKAIDTVEDAAQDGINEVKAAARYVGKELTDAGEAIADGATTVAHAVGDAIHVAEKYMGHAVIAGVTAFNKIV